MRNQIPFSTITTLSLLYNLHAIKGDVEGVKDLTTTEKKKKREGGGPPFLSRTKGLTVTEKTIMTVEKMTRDLTRSSVVVTDVLGGSRAREVTLWSSSSPRGESLKVVGVVGVRSVSHTPVVATRITVSPFRE